MQFKHSTSPCFNNHGQICAKFCNVSILASEFWINLAWCILSFIRCIESDDYDLYRMVYFLFSIIYIIIIIIIIIREMLMSALRVLVKNSVKESFYEKRKKKKQLKFWQLFSFSLKVMSKLFLTGFLTSALRALISMILFYSLLCLT